MQSPTAAIVRQTENSDQGMDTYWSSGVCTTVAPHLFTQMFGGDPTSASCCARQSDIACSKGGSRVCHDRRI